MDPNPGLSKVTPPPPDVGAGGDRDASTDLPPAPASAGPYRLVRRIGRGGSADVYLAECADGAATRRVAVKILHWGLDTDVVLARLGDARHDLSALDHPGIGRFLGGGSTDDGRPYLVTEYVDGTPITDYCDRKGLPLDRRLELFIQVAGILQSAHQRLVVHRDVKPSNVLVDARGRIKLLDCGVARILEPSWDGGATRIGHRVLTPAYASPEQILGEPITTASDVYQLGILLCELLTGRRPYEVKGLSPAAAERAVVDTPPNRPSDLVSTDAAEARGLGVDGLRRRLRGDLDTIVWKALRKDPEDRYPSPSALADDVSRHQLGFPVSAGPDSVPYRVRKFTRRHRLGVGMTAMAILGLGAASFTFRYQAGQARSERDRAQAAQEQAERVTDFVTRLLRVADPDAAGPEALNALPVLDAGLALARAELGDDPAVLADVLGTIGSLFSTLGHRNRADSVLSEALALRRAGADDPEGLVDDLLGLAWLRGEALGRVDEGERLFAEAARVATGAFGPRSPRLAEALSGMADLPIPGHEGLTSEARRRLLADSAIAILRGHPEEEVAEALASALYVSATLPGAGDRILPEFREALTLRRSFVGAETIGVAVILNDMALYLEHADPVAADTLMAEAAELHARLLGLQNRTTLTILNNQAAMLRDQGRYLDAEPVYRRVLDVRLETFPDDDVAIAYSLHGLGWVLSETGRPVEAEGHLREMIRLLRRAGDDGTRPRFQFARSTLGRSLALQDRFAEAEPLLKGSWEWYRERYPESVVLETLQRRLVELYVAWGRPEEARRIQGMVETDVPPP